MKQTCSICGKEIETGAFGGLPMKQHYRHKHPSAYFGRNEPHDQTDLSEYTR